VDPTGLQYFKNRLTQARRDVAHGLKFRLDYFTQTRGMQELPFEILQFKLNVLWSLADAIMLDQCNVQITGPKT
jgi:pyrroloquinoline-quinone synthase